MSTAPIVFLPEKGHSNWLSCSCDEEANSSRDTDTQSITGDEAKRFYEEIVSRPEQNKNDKVTSLGNRRHSRRKRSGEIQSEKPQLKRKDATKDSGASNSGPSTISVSQTFVYAQNNELELLKSALSGRCCDVNVRDNFNWTLLMVASHAGHVSIVKYLLSQGARWRDVVDQRGRNAVDLARLGGHAHVVDIINTSVLEHEGECGSLDDTVCVATSRRAMKRCADLRRTGRISKKGCHSFHCKPCQVTVTGSPRDAHDTSTVHLFSCQHHRHAHVSYGITEGNRGYQMLLRSGWDPEKGLGPHKLGKMFPVKTVLKRDRRGFGLGKTKSRVTHFSAHDTEAIQTASDRNSRECVPKRKKDILQASLKDRQWEIKMRAILNDGHN